jgi:hypothetical protein
MKQWSLLSRAVVISAVATVTAIVAVNVLVDPYAVLHTVSWPKHGYTDNDRYNKMEHLLAGPPKYDSYILGSSRMGFYDPEQAQGLLGGHFYNLSVFGGTPGDALAMLRVLDARGHPIDRVVVGIDIIPFMSINAPDRPDYRHHPEVLQTSEWSYWLDYVMRPSLMHSSFKIMQNWSEVPTVAFQYSTDGRYSLPLWEKELNDDWGKYRLAHFSAEPTAPKAVQWRQAGFEELTALRDWLRSREVQTLFFIDPHHHEFLSRLAPAALIEFRQKIRSILGEIPDFMTHPYWSGDDKLFYEPKHYRPVLAAQVLDMAVFQSQHSKRVSESTYDPRACIEALSHRCPQ